MAKPTRDLDSQMLFGCTSFLLASLPGFACTVAPFFYFNDLADARSLAAAVGVGLLLSLVLTVVLTRRAGMAGALGAIGGAMASAIFMYLRIDQAFDAFLAREAHEPVYPQLLKYIVPLAFLLCVALVACLSIPDESKDRSLNP